MTFATAFLGSLFAIAVAALIVYTYIVHVAIPRFMKGLRAFVEEIGPRAVFERMNLDPAEAMRQLGVTPTKTTSAIPGAVDPQRDAVRVIFTCEDHGRCAGCPKVLAQFEAIVRHQGADSFDEVERRCYEQLRERVQSDAPIGTEGETDRQRRLAAQVIEVLVREGFTPTTARGVVWGCGKDVRDTFAGWLSAAREDWRQRTRSASREEE